MESMEEIYLKYERQVYRYLMSLCRDPDLAEELCQETFCQALRTISRYQEKSALFTWLCGIARNVWRTYRQKNHYQEQVAASAHLYTAVSSLSPEEIYEEQDEKERLRRAVSRLPEAYRQAVELRIYEDMSFAQIASMLGWTETKARVTFYRAKEKLRKELL